MIEKVISGGQTGADRAALDWAIWHEVPHGGWCPKGRKALDGPLNSRYELEETPSADYLQRTEWNARDSDAAVIFTMGADLTGGSRRTAGFAKKHHKPWIHIPSVDYEPAGTGYCKRLQRPGEGPERAPGCLAAVPDPGDRR